MGQLVTGLFGGSQREIDVLRAQRPYARASGAPGLNCMILGAGGREYALAWSLMRADSVATIDCLPGNGGTTLFARNIDLDPRDAAALERHVAAAQIDLAIVGTDELVALGLGDTLRRCQIAVVAPSREAARIEWSKSFAKELMAEAGVPTARSTTYPSALLAEAALEGDGPVVLKADGLAAGKGVVIAPDRDAARTALRTPPLSDGPVLVEELLEGPEVSLQALVDGDTVVALPPARDHKRFGDGDTGPNTGGMGACSPVAELPDAEAQDAAERYIAPVARLLAARGTPFRGVIFAGLIRAADGWRVLEYNARFGDPEAQVTLTRLAGDLGRLLMATGSGRLAEHVREHPVRFSPRAVVDVVLCAEGYPGAPRVGDVIEGADAPPEGVYFIHGATRRVGNALVTAGGRVMHVVGTGETVAEARTRAYAAAERVTFEGRTYRSDIAAERSA